MQPPSPSSPSLEEASLHSPVDDGPRSSVDPEAGALPLTALHGEEAGQHSPSGRKKRGFHSPLHHSDVLVPPSAHGQPSPGREVPWGRVHVGQRQEDTARPARFWPLGFGESLD